MRGHSIIHPYLIHNCKYAIQPICYSLCITWWISSTLCWNHNPSSTLRSNCWEKIMSELCTFLNDNCINPIFHAFLCDSFLATWFSETSNCAIAGGIFRSPVFWIQKVQPTTALELWWLHKISFLSVTIWVLEKSKCHIALNMGMTKRVKQFVDRNSCSTITWRGVNSAVI
jgi:hypothetical protein